MLTDCQVADLCSSMCTNEEANKLLHTVSKQFHALTPQVSKDLTINKIFDQSLEEIQHILKASYAMP